MQQLSKFSLVYDKRKEGWELVQNVKLSGEPSFELAGFLTKNETCVKGEIILKRARAIKGRGRIAGQLHAEWLLSKQDSIPKEWRLFFLIFLGTVWCRPDDGSMNVPCLYWSGEGWQLRFVGLTHDFHSFFRIVRLRN